MLTAPSSPSPHLRAPARAGAQKAFRPERRSRAPTPLPLESSWRGPRLRITRPSRMLSPTKATARPRPHDGASRVLAHDSRIHPVRGSPTTPRAPRRGVAQDCCCGSRSTTKGSRGSCAPRRSRCPCRCSSSSGSSCSRCVLLSPRDATTTRARERRHDRRRAGDARGARMTRERAHARPPHRVTQRAPRDRPGA